MRALLDPEAGARGLFPLLSLAALYGIVHALGPGHQKTLLGGYFLGEGGSAGKAALAAVVTSALHASSVLAVFGGLAAATRSLADTEKARCLMTRGAGIVLLVLTVTLAAQRIRRAALRLRKGSPIQDRVRNALPSPRPPYHGDGCSCPACRSMERRRSAGAPFWSMLLAGGLIPCPGAAFFLLAGVSAGNPTAGILAVMALSAGMAITLFVVALGAATAHTAALHARYRSERGRDVALSVVEIAGAAVMVAFAALLVF